MLKTVIKRQYLVNFDEVMQEADLSVKVKAITLTKEAANQGYAVALSLGGARLAYQKKQTSPTLRDSVIKAK